MPTDNTKNKKSQNTFKKWPNRMCRTETYKNWNKKKTFKGDKVTEERANWKVRNIAQYTSWRGKIMVEFYYLFNGNSKEKGDRENKPETIFQPLLAKNSLGQIHRSTNS